MTKAKKKPRGKAAHGVAPKSALLDAVAMAGGQQALAETLGMTQQAVSRWVVRGYAPIEPAAHIARHLGVPLIPLLKASTRVALDPEQAQSIWD